MASDFTTRARVKQSLGIPAGVTRHDAMLDDFVDRVDGRLVALLGLPTITRTTFTEKHDIRGDRQRAVRLRSTPVVTVTAVVDGTTTRDGSDYYVEDADTGWLRLVSSTDYFSSGNQQVQVTYQAGWTTTDYAWLDFERLATGLCCEAFNREKHEGVRSFKTGGTSFNLDSEDLPPRLRRIVREYARAVPHSGG